MSIRDITLGRYVHGASFLHLLDPRTKLLASLLIMGALFAGEGARPVALALGFTMLAGVLSGLPFSYLLRSMLPFKWLIIVTVLLNILFTGGHILVEAPLPYGGITAEGLEFGFLYGARIALLVLLASLLTLTTEPVVLVDGVEKLLRPFARFGLRPHDIALAMVITIRFIPVLLDEAVKIRKSHAARGLRPLGIRANLKSVSILFVPLFISAVRRAEELAVAMESRLYRSGGHRTRYREIRMTARDGWTLLVTLLFSLSMVL
ncbi:MAG: energy-coupling factor transporter transmembrane component T family protein [Candidatus Latescibacterota bacterium]